MPEAPDFGLFARHTERTSPADTALPANWVAVACATHVRLGHAGGFMQVNHGKAAPLRRVRPGDRVVYYSPTDRMGERAPLQAFTAIGIVGTGEPYIGHMANGFSPFRRDVAWFKSQDVPIKPLLQTLDFTAGDRNWGYKLRFGLFAIGARDLDVIAIAMGAGPELLKSPWPTYALSGPVPVDLWA